VIEELWRGSKSMRRIGGQWAQLGGGSESSSSKGMSFFRGSQSSMISLLILTAGDGSGRLDFV